MQRRVLKLAALLLAAMTGCSQQSPAPRTASVAGTVSANGKPVNDAKITFHFESGDFWGAKVAEGRFSTQGLPVGQAKVCVESESTEVPAHWTTPEDSPLTIFINAAEQIPLTIDLTGNGFEVGAAPQPAETKTMTIGK